MVLISLAISFLACQQNAETEEAPAEQQQLIVEEIRISPEDIQALEYEDFVLDPDAQQAAADWEGFQELASSVEYLKTADLTFFKSDLEEVKAAIQKCEFNVTEAFYTESIMARFVVVETKFLKLQNDLTLDNISKDLQLQSIKDVFIAWSDFIYIINKKFEFEHRQINRPQ